MPNATTTLTVPVAAGEEAVFLVLHLRRGDVKLDTGKLTVDGNGAPAEFSTPIDGLIAAKNPGPAVWPAGAVLAMTWEARADHETRITALEAALATRASEK